jgi:hypothetical protein
VGFIVTDPTGRDVSPVFPQNGGEGATQLIVVPPGKNERFNYDLNELYKLGFFPNIVDSGEYVIVARMHMGDVDTKKSFVVYSNKIKVTLHPEFE